MAMPDLLTDTAKGCGQRQQAQVSPRRNSHSSIAGHDSASVNAGIDVPPIALASSFD
ncbi:hypothetical protein LZK73_11590 [Neorhizobium galegae]|nr:hypothetical protein LZK73_11590 [Neorhizobium galegae]